MHWMKHGGTALLALAGVLTTACERPVATFTNSAVVELEAVRNDLEGRARSAEAAADQAPPPGGWFAEQAGSERDESISETIRSWFDERRASPQGDV